MTWLAGILVALMGMLMLFLFWPMLVSVLLGFAVVVLLRKAISAAWAWQYKRAVRKNVLLAEQPIVKPIWLPFAAMLAALAGIVVALMALFVLSGNHQATPMLPMGMGMAGAACMVLLIWLVGEVCTGWKNRQKGLAWSAEPMDFDWWVVAGLLAIPSVLVIAFLAPDYAGVQVWRAQALGYESVPIHIVLAPADEERQRSQRDEAVMQIVAPLLERGSQKISVTLRSKHGTSTTTAALPARYRLDGDTLEIRLAGYLAERDLRLLLEPLQSMANGNWLEPSLLSLAQCQQQVAPRRMGGEGRKRFAQLQTCLQQRDATLRQLMPLLRGQVRSVNVLPVSRFSPWRWGPRWRKVDLPSGDALDEMALLAR